MLWALGGTKAKNLKFRKRTLEICILKNSAAPAFKVFPKHNFVFSTLNSFFMKILFLEFANSITQIYTIKNLILIYIEDDSLYNDFDPKFL